MQHAAQFTGHHCELGLPACPVLLLSFAASMALAGETTSSTMQDCLQMERIARESVEDLPEQVEAIRGDLVQRQVRDQHGASMEQVAGAAGPSRSWSQPQASFMLSASCLSGHHTH